MEWKVGDTLKTLTKPEITREQLHAYAQASGDKNPVHLDDRFAAELGFPSVIAHGMLSMAIMADHLRFNFPKQSYRLLRLKTRFRQMTFPGDILECTGVIKAIDKKQIALHLKIQNQKGDLTTEGDATVESV